MNMNNLSFKKKLSLLQMIPLAGLLMLAAYGIKDKVNVYSEMNKVEELATLATKISSFVHELQMERGATTVYLSSGGYDYSSEVDKQREQTNKSHQVLNMFLKNFDPSRYGTSLGQDLSEAMGNADKLNSIREQVSALSISNSKVSKYYTLTNSKLLNLIGEISNLSSNSRVSNINTGYVNLLKGKEIAGIERAMLSKVFLQDNISVKKYQQFYRLITEQNMFFESFLAIATPSQTDAFNIKMNSPVVADLQKMREAIFKNRSHKYFKTDVEHWFKTSSERIDDLKEIEDEIASDLIEIAHNGAVAGKNALVLIISIALAIVLVTLYFGFIINRQISRSIHKLQTTMFDVEKNSDLSLRVDVMGNDEIALMGESLNKMLKRFGQLIENIVESSNELSTSATNLFELSKSSTDAITEQLSGTEQIATATTEMSSSSQTVAKNAQDASSATRDADQLATSGKTVVVEATNSITSLVNEVERTKGVIHELENGSVQIGGVLDVIRGIAEQTNLLALNAAIEAARAGEQGRGFAVVADEVRNLAGRTQESTQEIQNMIQQLQIGTNTAVQAMEQASEQAKACSELANKTTDVISGITDAVSSITDMNVQIANAADEQSTVAEEINRKTVSISSISYEATDTAKQTAAASSQLSSLANDLEGAVSIFKM